MRAEDGTPATQSLLSNVNQRFRVFLATKNAFPDHATAIAEIIAAFREACTETHAHRRQARFNNDPEYERYIREVVRVTHCLLLPILSLSEG